MQRIYVISTVLGVFLILNVGLTFFMLANMNKLSKDIDELKTVTTSPQVTPSFQDEIPFIESQDTERIAAPTPLSYPTTTPLSYTTPTQAPSVKPLPTDIQHAYSLPIMQICVERGLAVRYQLDDGTNIYIDNGTYVRGKAVVCGN